MKRRWLRYGLVVLALLVVIGGLGGIKFGQIHMLMAFGETMKQAGPPPESVGTTVAEAQAWEQTLTAVGSVEGVQSTAVAAEVPGTVKRIRFDSGEMVTANQPLVEIEADTELAQLRAAKARRDLARINEQRSKKLVDQGAVPRNELDAALTELATAEADVSALMAQIDRKTIRAPFAGRAGIRNVNLGQYLAPGTAVTTIESVGDMYVDFSLPQEDLGAVAVGNEVRIVGPNGGQFTGKIAAIDPSIDPLTRNVKLRAHVPQNESKLRSGMFVTVAVVLPAKTNVVVVPLTAVVRAPYGNSVFVVEQANGRTIARQQFVQLGMERGDFVAITKGVTANQTVVSEGAFKLRNNAPIRVDNSVKPKASLEPKPENR